MTPFMKYWITSTLAPESIEILRESSTGVLLSVVNENKTDRIILVESLDHPGVIGIGRTYDEIRKQTVSSYKKAVQYIAKEFGLLSVTI